MRRQRLVCRSIPDERSRATMISEKEFASGFPGFWSECLPFLTPQLVAEFNVKRTVVFDNSRVALKPLDSAGDNSQNDFVAETAFELFATDRKSTRLNSSHL